jgi:hypothetical protein
MNVLIGILIGAGALVLLNRQQIAATARLQYGPGYAPGGSPGVMAPPRLNLPASTFGGYGGGDGVSADFSEGSSAAGAAVGLAHSGALGSGLAASSAIPIAGAVIGVVGAIVGPLLAAHRARIAGATSENSHNAAVTALFDQAIPQIVAYWNKTHDKAGSIGELKQLQQYLYTTMKGRVGQAGTHWDDATGVAGKCNKACTAGCCIYYGDFAGGGAPAYTGINGLISAVQNGGRRSVTMPKVYPGKYSSFTRPLYTVTLK